MKPLLRSFMILIAWISLAASAAGLDIRYVNADNLNTRSAPDGATVGTLARSAAVVVKEQRGSWARVDDAAHSDRWVSAQHLCRGVRCWGQTGSASVGFGSRLAPARTTPASRPASTGGCSCSSSSNCYGPRGGRYCITSGGNKRYR